MNKEERFKEHLIMLVESRGYDAEYATFDNWYGFVNKERFMNKYNEEPPEPYRNNEQINGEFFDFNEKYGSYHYRCICGQTYDEPSYIAHKTIENLYSVIGQSCLLKILPSENRLKLCTKCNKPYRGKFKKCKNCRESEPVLNFGKYKGIPICEIDDEQYLNWVLNKIPNLNINTVSEINRSRQTNTVFNFGKYRGKDLSEINDKQYLKWVAHNVNNLNPDFRDKINEKISLL